MTIPDWVDYFKEIVNVVSTKSTCLRRQVGSIAVLDRRILSTGYNGQIKGSPHCVTCLREELNIPSGSADARCMAVHAEQNLIGQAATHGISLKDSTAVLTCKPCISCYKLMMNSGIKNILYFEDYPDETTGVIVKLNNSVIHKYKTYYFISKKNDHIFGFDKIF